MTDEWTRDDWIRTAVDEHEGPLIRYATSLLGDADRAREVVQEAFLRLCRQPRHKVERGLKTWLFVTCRRSALDVLKKESRMERLDDSQPPQPTAGAEPGTQVELEETQRRLLAHLAELPEKQREVIRLKFSGGLSYAQIAEVTGLKSGYVGYLIHHGLKNLRERMNGGETG